MTDLYIGPQPTIQYLAMTSVKSLHRRDRKIKLIGTGLKRSGLAAAIYIRSQLTINKHHEAAAKKIQYNLELALIENLHHSRLWEIIVPLFCVPVYCFRFGVQYLRRDIEIGSKEN